jgi:hypothetical protein
VVAVRAVLNVIWLLCGIWLVPFGLASFRIADFARWRSARPDHGAVLRDAALPVATRLATLY